MADPGFAGRPTVQICSVAVQADQASLDTPLGELCHHRVEGGHRRRVPDPSATQVDLDLRGFDGVVVKIVDQIVGGSEEELPRNREEPLGVVRVDHAGDPNHLRDVTHEEHRRQQHTNTDTERQIVGEDDHRNR